MSIWWRPTPATEGRSQPALNLEQAYRLFGHQSYVDVNLTSAESSLQSVAVGAAVDLIASTGSELPVHVYSGEASDRVKRRPPGYLDDPAGDGYGLADWSYKALTSWLLRGNLYGDVLATGRSGQPTQVELFHPDQVSGYLDDQSGRVIWHAGGQRVPDGRMLHRRVNPMPGLVLGLSPIQLKATQIGLTLTTSKFGLQFFQDGATPSGFLINEERSLNAEQARTAKDRFMAALRGTREIAVLDRGWKYQQVQIAPEESQFLETQRFTEAQCARIFGAGIAEVLGYESGGGLQYANVVDRDLHLLKYSLNKWLRRLERLLTDMLPRPQYAVLDRDALLQTDTLTRYRAHSIALRDGWKVINEVRPDEELPPVSWGNEPFTPAQQPGKDDTTEGGTS